MRRRPLSVVAAALVPLVLLLAQGLLAAPGVADGKRAGQPVYLALGDSVAAGVGAPEGEGYVDLLYDELRERFDCRPADQGRVHCKPLALVDLSDSGATSATLLADQLPAALAVLERNRDRNPRNDVEVITLTIGGNDLIRPVALCALAQTQPCEPLIQQLLTTYTANVTQILTQLRAAAGPHTTIVTTAYYNPLPACFLAELAPLADVVLEGGPGLPAGLNDITRQVSAAVGAQVAEAYGQLTPADLVGGQDCLHPDASGHERLAGIFADGILA